MRSNATCHKLYWTQQTQMLHGEDRSDLTTRGKQGIQAQCVLNGHFGATPSSPYSAQYPLTLNAERLRPILACDNASRLGVRRFSHPHRAATASITARDLGVATYHTIKHLNNTAPRLTLSHAEGGSVRCIMAEPREDESASVNDLSPEEVSRIIHSHRKVRYGKAATFFFFFCSSPASNHGETLLLLMWT
jgi:hypothetical protein